LIEAFEIGVSLALRDGVSDSIILAQRNLAALETAVTSSAFAIQSLRDAGLRAASIPALKVRNQLPSSPVPQVAKNTKLTERDGSGTADDIFVSRGQEKREALNTSGVVPIAAPVGAAKPDLVRLNAPELIFQQPAPISTPDDLTQGMQRVAPIGGEPSQARANLLSAVSVRSDSAPDGGGAAPSTAAPDLPQTPLSVMPPAITLRAMSFGQDESRAGDSGTQSMNLARFSDLHENPWSLDRAEATIMFASGSGDHGNKAEARTHDSEIANATLLPQGPRASVNWGSSPAEFNENANQGGTPKAWVGYPIETSHLADRQRFDKQRNSVAPDVQRDEKQTLTGDVYLDGMLVGRWVSRFLQKQAERAEVGPTGFDAKRGRLLPGVTVGG
jgi:hypothetical protein